MRDGTVREGCSVGLAVGRWTGIAHFETQIAAAWPQTFGIEATYYLF